MTELGCDSRLDQKGEAISQRFPMTGGMDSFAWLGYSAGLLGWISSRARLIKWDGCWAFSLILPTGYYEPWIDSCD